MNKLTSRPLGVLLIAGFYLFGAATLAIMYILNVNSVAAQIATRHGLPDTTGSWILLAVAGLGMIIAIGLASLSRLGYIFTIAYLGYFCLINIYMAKGELATISYGNVIFSVVVIFYLLLVRRKFFPG